MFARILLALTCLFTAAACQDGQDGFTPVEPESVEAAAHLNAECNAPIDLDAHAALLDWARTHIDTPTQIEEGVVYIPEGFDVAESADARQMTTRSRRVIDGLQVRLPGPGPRPGTVWDCQCSANDDSGCYWRHLGGLSYCKGSCGDTRCRSKAIDVDDLEIGEIVMP